jgi:hypothetical protein
VRIVGIVEEQHPERALLFLQWKQVDWPLWVDAMDSLELAYVPILLGVDEHGVVRGLWPMGMGSESWRTEFLDVDFDLPAAAPGTSSPRNAAPSGADIDGVVAAHEKALAAAPGDGWAQFRLGVAYRMRHDSQARRDGDFARAVQHWTRALEIDPNNYIWRRRLQQYGPLPAKPYPFYDWVEEARAAIAARGETAFMLRVEPAASERALPGRAPATVAGQPVPPDAHGRVHRDPGVLVRAEAASVPATVGPGGTLRVHVSLRPVPGTQAHWNNEVDDPSLWIELPEGWECDRRLVRHPRPAPALSREERVLEFELRVPETAAAGTVAIPAYALYYVCEDAAGACLYRRQDVAIPVQVGETAVLGGR